MYIPNHVSRPRSYNHTSVPLCFCGDILISCEHYTKVICQEGLEDKAHAHEKPGAWFRPFSITSLLTHAHYRRPHPCSDASARKNRVFIIIFLNHAHSSSILCCLTTSTSFRTSLLHLQVRMNGEASAGTAGRQRTAPAGKCPGAAAVGTGQQHPRSR